MTDPLEQFAQLAARARQESPPPVDVTAQVVADLRRVRPLEPVDRTMLIFSALAVAASLAVAAWGLDAWSMLSDPMANLMQPLSGVMQ